MIHGVETERDRHYYINTLAGLVKACEGRRTVLELRDNTSIFGTIVSVDGHLNIIMSSVVYKRPQCKTLRFDEFFVRGNKLRHVLIPNDVDIREAIEQQLHYYVHGRKNSHSGKVKLNRRLERTTQSSLDRLGSQMAKRNT